MEYMLSSQCGRDSINAEHIGSVKSVSKMVNHSMFRMRLENLLNVLAAIGHGVCMSETFLRKCFMKSI
ncbi:hypothetical protein HK407_12g18080 [Ordospora pajunii]|uniref:uncharacterized protein n=1 Tax=Ordospora pajunii TaxID=3039483 RepID=UPI00295277E1|nr:uncharacterized protein HK407_12g18080 [Ordospora pajunii]KAH9410676.1 hypothetical protein HK407_12g18080 [Ordospora pajunii]